jgi:hypothetical protein
MAPDTWSRHRIVSRLAGSPASLLDVGGVARELAPFLPGTRIVTANVEEGADVIFDGVRLPFPEGSFEAAASLDVLEHVPREQRANHLADLVRVAERQVVLCCPLGSPAHEAAERELADWHQSVTGRRHRFLDEHLQRGLPSEEELRELAAAAPMDFDLRFHGDFEEANELFRLSTLVKHRPRPGLIARYARARFGPRSEGPLTERPQPRANRAFLVGRRG